MLALLSRNWEVDLNMLPKTSRLTVSSSNSSKVGAPTRTMRSSVTIKKLKMTRHGAAVAPSRTIIATVMTKVKIAAKAKVKMIQIVPIHGSLSWNSNRLQSVASTML